MLEYIAAAGLAGWCLGWWAGHRGAGLPPERPMRLVHVNDFTAPGLAPKSGAELGQWELSTIAFTWQASMVGSFAYRPLRDAGVIRRRGWEIYCDVLRQAGIIQSSERSATWWAGGWSTSRLRVELKHGAIALPFPAGAPPAINSAWLGAQMARRSTVAHAERGQAYGTAAA